MIGSILSGRPMMSLMMKRTISKKQFAKRIEATETNMLLKDEMEVAQEEFMAAAEDVEMDDIAPDHGSESEQEAASPVAKREKKGPIPKTLSDVLHTSGLLDFQPPDDDNEAQMLARIHALGKPMRAFSSYTRCSEGILSKASVLGHGPKPREQWQLEKELARARAEFTCSAQRQSRHSLWAEYSERVLKIVSQLAEEGDASAAKGAIEVKAITPSTFTLDNGERACQILVIRPMKTGGLRLGVVMTAWRGGKDKKKSKNYLWAERSLPKYAATKLHLKILKPMNVQDENRSELLTANAASAMVAIDPADEDSVIMEIPATCFKYDFTPEQLEVWLSRASVKAIAKSVPFHAKTKKAMEEPMQKTFFTESDFQRGQALAARLATATSAST